MIADADIYRVIARIPVGAVTTYGAIAAAVGLRDARRIGYALARLDDDSTIPWHRVVRADGSIAARADRYWADLQRVLLTEEGVPFDAAGRVVMSECRWMPDD